MILRNSVASLLFLYLSRRAMTVKFVRNGIVHESIYDTPILLFLIHALCYYNTDCFSQIQLSSAQNRSITIDFYLMHSTSRGPPVLSIQIHNRLNTNAFIFHKDIVSAFTCALKISVKV